MQVFSGTIESRTAGVVSTAPLLINTNFSEEISVTKSTISKICVVEDCSNPYRSKGYCNKHYRRVLRHGDPYIFRGIRARTLQGFFDRLHRKDGPTQPHMDTPCWEWIGSMLKDTGYGQLKYNYKSLRAHRVSFFLHYGYWPLNALHKCDFRRCVRWDHLYDGTQKDNVRDALERGRHYIGERNNNAKLTNDQVIEIKQRISQGERNRDIAPDYGVHVNVVSSIRHNRSWKHIEV